MFDISTVQLDWQGLKLKLETGLMARQADGAVLATLGSVAESLMALYALYYFAGIIPNLSMSIRRVRDMGKSWPWIFINLLPIAGPIWFLLLLCRPSVPFA